MNLRFHNHFKKEIKKRSKKEQALVKERLELFLLEPFHPRLRNHSLRGRYDGYRSIDIRSDLPAIYKDLGDTAVFVALGSHNQLYR